MGLTFYFLRHGQTALSREDVFCGSGLDPELTPEGREMAEAFVKAYREVEWGALYSSSLRRSITTAQPLCDARRINLRVHAKIAFEFKDGNSQAQLKPSENGDYEYKYVVMPMRI